MREEPGSSVVTLVRALNSGAAVELGPLFRQRGIVAVLAQERHSRATDIRTTPGGAITCTVEEDCYRLVTVRSVAGGGEGDQGVIEGV